MTLKAGLRWLAASLIAYLRESFSLRKYNDGSSASTYKLVTLRDVKSCLKGGRADPAQLGNTARLKLSL